MSPSARPPDASIDALLRPLSARSLVASALLGSHPPALPGRLLVAMGERFGIKEGTTRVALSRMVDRGELHNRGGVYELTGALLERQERQDRSRPVSVDLGWDRSWSQAVVVGSGRSAGARQQLRRHLASLGLGELREGVWMRPANLDPQRLPATRDAIANDVEWFRVTPDDDAGLAARLFELDAWAATARSLASALAAARARLSTDDDAVVTGFNLASATLRHLVHDPQLPAELEPSDWPASSIRSAYVEFESDYQQLLRRFLRQVPGA